MSLLRPDTLTETVGNENIKKVINVTLQSAIAQNDAFPHTLIYGSSGLGKTSFANVIANEIGGEFKSYLSNVFRNKDDVRMALIEMNEEGYDRNFEIVGRIKPTVLFLDEIHELSTKVQEAFFEAMEDNRFTSEQFDVNSGKREKVKFWLPRFTLIGATTKAGDLDEAFISRFKLVFTLNLYTEEELQEIIWRWTNFYKIEISKDALKEIARRSRGIPRKALNFVERCRDTAIYNNQKLIDIKIVYQTFKLLDVDIGGLENQDRQVLVYLYTIYPQKIGSTRLASTMNISENILKEIIEPYLMRLNLVIASPKGRVISPKGIEYCEKNNLVEIPKTSGILRRLQ